MKVFFCLFECFLNDLQYFLLFCLFFCVVWIFLVLIVLLSLLRRPSIVCFVILVVCGVLELREGVGAGA
jgi:hypothetical protein